MKTDMVIVVFNEKMSHKDEQQNIFITKIKTFQCPYKVGGLYLCDIVICLCEKCFMSYFIVIHFFHQVVESVKESLEVYYWLYVMNICLILF